MLHVKPYKHKQSQRLQGVADIARLSIGSVLCKGKNTVPVTRRFVAQISVLPSVRTPILRVRFRVCFNGKGRVYVICVCTYLGGRTMTGPMLCCRRLPDSTVHTHTTINTMNRARNSSCTCRAWKYPYTLRAWWRF